MDFKHALTEYRDGDALKRFKSYRASTERNSFIAVHAVCQLIQVNQALFFKDFDRFDFLQLALVSKDISRVVKHFIESRYCFSIPVAFKNHPLSWYNPICITLYSMKNLPTLIRHNPTITQVILHKFFNDIIESLPQNITHLTFGVRFKRSVNFSLHPNITHLKFGYYFNKPIKNKLPPNITHLTLGSFFNRPIDNLPQKITHLILGKRFNETVNSFPDSLIYLRLGWHFKQELRLPPNLQVLILGGCFTSYNTLNVPTSLRKLIIIGLDSKADIFRSSQQVNLPAGCKLIHHPRPKK